MKIGVEIKALSLLKNVKTKENSHFPLSPKCSWKVTGEGIPESYHSRYSGFSTW